jgi:hypothetical protein
MGSRPDISEVERWLDEERGYAEGKWAPGEVDDTITPERYAEWVNQYMSRALVLAQDGWNPLARQALAKSLRTMLAFNESMVRRFGPLPRGGVPSGEIKFHANERY